MKNNFYLLIILCLLSSLQVLTAQSEIPDILLNTISSETCDCLNEKSSSGEQAKGKSELNVGVCMMEVSAKHREELAENGITLDNATAFEKLGEKVGTNLAVSCDKFIELLFEAMKDGNGIKDEAPITVRQNTIVSPVLAMTGFIDKVEEDLFLRLWVEYDKGVAVFICQEAFEGLALLENPEKLYGKKVKLSYRIISVYSPREKAMIEMKKVMRLELL